MEENLAQTSRTQDHFSNSLRGQIFLDTKYSLFFTPNYFQGYENDRI